MTTTAGSVKPIMQRSKGKASGWAAFDHAQRQKQGIELEVCSDPYPPISSEKSACKNSTVEKSSWTRTFSSVAGPSLTHQGVMNASNSRWLSSNSRKKHDDYIAAESITISPREMLKKSHNWANEDLIEDILAAAEYDEKQASLILQSMAPADLREDHVDFVISGAHHDKGQSHINKAADSSNNISATTLVSDCAYGKLGTSNAFSCVDPTIKNTFSPPVEPEWEEDDVYIVHRKDAIKTMRAASQHSRAASNAFLMGDHFSARQLSLKAQEEWEASDKLNAMAAKQILSMRNKNNDIWKLDLHGLHASEAVKAIKEHLLRIESEIIINNSASLSEMTKVAEGTGHSSQDEPDNGSIVAARTDIHFPLRRRDQSILHVITGTGNHSRGQAALPTAVRSFLIENMYRFDDARPGVIAVRPKFRRS